MHLIDTESGTRIKYAWPYFPFAEPFFELNTADVVESVGSAVVGVELRGTEIAFDIEVTVVTTDPATSPSPATGNMACDV